MIDSTQSFRFFNRGPSPVARLVFFAVLSLLLLFVDARYRYLESTRSALSVLVSPIQWLATLPSALWQQADDFFITQSTQRGLIKQNDDLSQRHQSDAAQLLQLQALQLENQQLRNLAALPIRNEFTSQLVEVIYAERDVFKRKVLINKGADADVRIGQVVMDDIGIVGQKMCIRDRRKSARISRTPEWSAGANQTSATCDAAPHRQKRAMCTPARAGRTDWHPPRQRVSPLPTTIRCRRATVCAYTNTA